MRDRDRTRDRTKRVAFNLINRDQHRLMAFVDVDTRRVLSFL